MSEFVFKSYDYDSSSKQATFTYHNNGFDFTEVITFNTVIDDYDKAVLEKALFLAFVLIGTSYYKVFPAASVRFEAGEIDGWQAKFFNSVYQEGLSQFAFENDLSRKNLAEFSATASSTGAVEYRAADQAPLVLQSGGKDSLLLAQLLSEKSLEFDPWYLQASESHPEVLDSLQQPLSTATRSIDMPNLKAAQQKGGFNGHVPVTYIVQSIALLQAILMGKSTVLAAIGHEGEEPYGFIDDLPVRHQWAKTWQAELQFQKYVTNYISPSLHIGSNLRRYSELKIAELFVKHCWQKYSRKFSSCNVGNYKQGQDNQHLGWCGNCPKCANSFLLFAPFVEPDELIAVFNGENLFQKPSLSDIFKGLLGIHGVAKPFECIGEEAELRTAYHLARNKSSDYELPFEVPDANFDYKKEYLAQDWTADYI